MFRLLDDSATGLVEIELDGQPAQVPAGVPLAAALLYLDLLPARLTSLSASPRAPYCMMGICFECVVDVEGLGRRRSCQLEVSAGMRVRRLLSEAVIESGS